MKDKFKKAIFAIPGIGRGARIAKILYALPDWTHRQSLESGNLKKELSELKEHDNALEAQLKKTGEALSRLQLQIENMQQKVDLHRATVVSEPATRIGGGPADAFVYDHSWDVFYTKFEDKFRGSEAIIKDRLKEYLPYFLASSSLFKKAPLLDIGSGRGELLILLKEQGIDALGVDLNMDMVERARKKGLKVEQGDAITYLQNAPSHSLGAITGFHLVEHIPFNLLLRLFSSAHRALVSGGFVIFETPNPENVTVGSYSFYLDPSHLHPLPPVLLAFALETIGFQNIEIKRLHPAKSSASPTHLPPEIVDGFYGPRDYAVIAYKPSSLKSQP